MEAATAPTRPAASHLLPPSLLQFACFMAASGFVWMPESFVEGHSSSHLRSRGHKENLRTVEWTPTPGDRKMAIDVETRAIGRLPVSVAGLGCNNFGRRIDEERSRSVVEAALDAGVTAFDTAESYGDGRSEEFLGRALGRRRDQAVIVTKFSYGAAER